MATLHPTNTARLQAVRDARDAAEVEARRSVGRGGMLRSRGMEFTVAGGPRGDKMNEAGTWVWDGRASSFEADLKRLLNTFPAATAIYLEGGFDYAESLRAALDGELDVWVSDWAVEVWRA